jgi:hypothetical protein
MKEEFVLLQEGKGDHKEIISYLSNAALSRCAGVRLGVNGRIKVGDCISSIIPHDRLPFVRLHYRGNHKITVCLISPQISRFALHCEVFTFSRDFL